MKPYYETALQSIDRKIAADRSVLYVENDRRPWCLTSLASEFPLINQRYQANLVKSNKIRMLLGQEPIEGIDSGTQEAKWQKHLAANPNLKIWAEANPAAASKVRDCPA